MRKTTLFLSLPVSLLLIGSLSAAAVPPTVRETDSVSSLNNPQGIVSTASSLNSNFPIYASPLAKVKFDQSLVGSTPAPPPPPPPPVNPEAENITPQKPVTEDKENSTFKVPPLTKPSNADIANAQNYAAEQLRARNLIRDDDVKELACLVDLWNKESGWNYLAKNPSSGAYGIVQALPAQKMASAGPDWLTNPQTQIKWGLSYITDRYKTPCGALAAWQSRSPNWY